MHASAPSVRNPASPTRILPHVGFANWLPRGIAIVRAIGPYAVIEIVLPGGTLLACLLWLYRQHQSGKPVRPIIIRSLRKMRLGVRRIIEATAGVCSRLTDRDVTAAAWACRS
jgi:hypothetical protein